MLQIGTQCLGLIAFTFLKRNKTSYIEDLESHAGDFITIMSEIKLKSFSFLFGHYTIWFANVTTFRNVQLKNELDLI